jgi:hypothetical protein
MSIMPRADNPQAKHESLRLNDCANYPRALGGRTFGSHRLIDAVTARTRLALNAVFEASSLLTLKGFTLLTGAISFKFQIGELRSFPLSAQAVSQSKLGWSRARGACCRLHVRRFLKVFASRSTDARDASGAFRRMLPFAPAGQICNGNDPTFQ